MPVKMSYATSSTPKGRELHTRRTTILKFLAKLTMKGASIPMTNGLQRANFIRSETNGSRLLQARDKMASEEATDSLFSCEAEYKSLASAIQEAKWDTNNRNLLQLEKTTRAASKLLRAQSCKNDTSILMQKILAGNTRKDKVICLIYKPTDGIAADLTRSKPI